MFNPLDLENLGVSIARAMGEQEAVSLDSLPSFEGAGIYALYYFGPHPAYKQLVQANVVAADPHPIYVGKAVSQGARKGVAIALSGSALRSRLLDHAKSIAAVANLELQDFQVRWLILDHVWVSLGESVLIRRHSPVWNALVDGFGNHDPGKGRLAGQRPRWDVLHPGRGWAARLLESGESADHIAQDVEEFLRQRL